MTRMTRRDCLSLTAASLASGRIAAAAGTLRQQTVQPEPKSVAAVITVWFPNSHADVILGKILDGWLHDGGPGPELSLVSLYVDQFPDRDLARETCRRHGVPICDSIREAVTVGGSGIPVDGVLSIGEHGSYPLNDIGQQMYPRRRFFEEITDTFEDVGRVVPVFNDKHLGPVWSDAKWMYDRAREMQIPFMAGSSLPVGFRHADIDVPPGCEIEAAVGIGYSGFEIYGIHALEFFQYYVERRRGAERGVRAVQFLEGPAIWEAVDNGIISTDALNAAFEAVPKTGTPDMRNDQNAGLFLFEYADGLTGGVLMLSCVSGTSIGLKLKGRSQPLATAFDERTTPRYPHFAYLVKAIEQMIHSGKPPWPVERTLLTSGILDRVLTSRAQGGVRLETPELTTDYHPVHYPHAPHFDLQAPPVKSHFR